MTPDRRWAARRTLRRPRGAMLYTPGQRAALHLAQAEREDTWADEAQTALDMLGLFPGPGRAGQVRAVVAMHRRRAEHHRRLAAAEQVAP